MQINFNPDTCTGSERCCCSEAVPKVQEETLRLFCVSQEKWQHTENLLIAQTSAPWRGPEEHAQIKSHGLTGSERCCIVEINARRNVKTLCVTQEKWQHTENLHLGKIMLQRSCKQYFGWRLGHQSNTCGGRQARGKSELHCQDQCKKKQSKK